MALPFGNLARLPWVTMGGAVLLALLAATHSGCSVLYDLSASQCSSDADCQALGAEFEGRTCIDGMCSTAPPECTRSSECSALFDNSPGLCRDGHCLRLTSDASSTLPQCPLLLGAGKNNANLDKNPQLIGLFGYMDQSSAFYYSQSTVNYELAINEYNAKATRPVVGVFCDGIHPNFDESLPLLVEQLGVSAIVAGMYNDELKNAFEWTQSHNKDVLFMSPLEASSDLAVLADKGLIWHVLGESADLAPAYGPLVTRAEAFIRSQPWFTGGNVRLALIESRPELSDLAAAVRKVIH